MGRLRNLVFVLMLAAPAAAFADPSCFGLCSVDCVKPISIPDRWDDNSVPGSVGWANNGVWDREAFSDTNGNGLHDPGEPFVDGSSAYSTGAHGPIDGKYNAESYDPLTTGYLAATDLGSEFVFGAGLGQHSYYPLDLPGGVGGTEAARCSWNWLNCNPSPVSIGDHIALDFGNVKGPTAQALRNIMDQDPSAYWDDACQCVGGSLGDSSPRLLIFAAQDPRIPLTVGGQSISVTKLIGFFLESADVNANIRGRFVQLHRTGSNSCSNGGDFIVDCAVPTEPITWGAVKATYR